MCVIKGTATAVIERLPFLVKARVGKMPRIRDDADVYADQMEE